MAEQIHEHQFKFKRTFKSTYDRDGYTHWSMKKEYRCECGEKKIEDLNKDNDPDTLDIKNNIRIERDGITIVMPHNTDMNIEVAKAKQILDLYLEKYEVDKAE